MGANKGSYLPSLARAVPQGRVIAFEPQAILAAYLTQVCALARFDNVDVVQKGLSDVEGSAVLMIPGTDPHSPGASLEAKFGSGESVRRVEVPVTTIDAMFDTRTARIGAIKIDVEGHEMAVLRGAGTVIAEDRPVVVVECEQRHLKDGKVASLFETMASAGYSGSFRAEGHRCDVAQFVPGVHQKQGTAEFWNAPDYVNNFIFLPPGRG